MTTILIIEDYADLRNDITEILGYEGYTVISAADGIEGIRLANEENPDVIVSDIMMPGMDGYEVFRRLREDAETSKIPFVFMTGTHAHEKSGAQADAYIKKPFPIDDLITMIEKVIKDDR
jgi:CheY-like chemotaxis protein